MLDQDYVGDSLLDIYKIDAELVQPVLFKMKRGKGTGLVDLMLEHVLYSHPVLIVILAKLLNLIVSAAYVPHGFRLSYTVLLPKEVCSQS